MKKPTIYLIIGLFLLLIVLVLFSMMNQSSVKRVPISNPDNQSQQNIINVSPEVTPTVASSNSKDTFDNFKVIKTSLTEKPIGTTTSFLIYFSQPISYKSFSYIIEPSIGIDISLNPDKKIVTVSPKETWGFNANYQLTIFSDTLSLDNSKLGYDFKLNFKSVPFSGY